MNGKRTFGALVALLVVAAAAAALWSRGRLREDPWADEPDDRDPVVLPVAAAGAPARVETTSYGPGSATSGPDGSGPSGWTIKAKASSRLYHLPESLSWERMHADVWFESEEAAKAAGFKRWDWRRNQA